MKQFFNYKNSNNSNNNNSNNNSKAHTSPSFTNIRNLFTLRSLLILSITLVLSFAVRWYIVNYFSYDLYTFKDFFITGILVYFVFKVLALLSEFNLFKPLLCEVKDKFDKYILAFRCKNFMKRDSVIFNSLERFIKKLSLNFYFIRDRMIYSWKYTRTPIKYSYYGVEPYRSGSSGWIVAVSYAVLTGIMVVDRSIITPSGVFKQFQLPNTPTQPVPQPNEYLSQLVCNDVSLMWQAVTWFIIIVSILTLIYLCYYSFRYHKAPTLKWSFRLLVDNLIILFKENMSLIIIMFIIILIFSVEKSYLFGYLGLENNIMSITIILLSNFIPLNYTLCISKQVYNKYYWKFSSIWKKNSAIWLFKSNIRNGFTQT